MASAWLKTSELNGVDTSERRTTRFAMVAHILTLPSSPQSRFLVAIKLPGSFDLGRKLQISETQATDARVRL